MSNITVNEALKSLVIFHPIVLGVYSNENLVDIDVKSLSDNIDVSEAGFGGGRIVRIKPDTARSIAVEVQNGSLEEAQLRRIMKYPDIPFSLTWNDASSLLSPKGGSSVECYIKNDASNKLTDKTVTFNIIALNYSAI